MKIIKNIAFILIPLIGHISFASDHQCAQPDAEFKAQQEAKNRSDLGNAKRELATRKLEDACTIMFEERNRGLPSGVQNIIFQYLQKMQCTDKITTNGGPFCMTRHSHHDGSNYIIVGFGSGDIEIYNEQTKKKIKELATNDDVNSVQTFSLPDGNWYILSASSDKHVRVFNGQTGALIKDISLPDGVNRAIRIRNKINEKFFIVTGDQKSGNNIKIWDEETGILLKTVEGHSNVIMDLAIETFNDGAWYIISGSDEKEIGIWDGEGKLIRRLITDNGVWSVASHKTNDGTWYIYAGEENGTISMWDGETGKLIKKLEGHSWYVNHIMIVPSENDNWFVISGSRDGTIKIWNGHGGSLIQTLKARGTQIDQINAFINEQKKLQVGSVSSSENMIRFWQYGSGKFEKAIIDQQNFEKAQAIMQNVSNADSQGQGLPLALQQLIADYAVTRPTN